MSWRKIPSKVKDATTYIVLGLSFGMSLGYGGVEAQVAAALAYGLGCNPHFRILDELGNPLPRGESGKVIRLPGRAVQNWEGFMLAWVCLVAVMVLVHQGGWLAAWASAVAFFMPHLPHLRLWNPERTGVQQ